MNINQIAEDINKNAIAHGWYDEERSFGDLISLCHSELSEALEEYRNGCEPTKTYYDCKAPKSERDEFGDLACCQGICKTCEYGKPEGIPSELADVIIRVLDMCVHYGIDIESAIREKHEYNKSRPYRHGGKTI